MGKKSFVSSTCPTVTHTCDTKHHHPSLREEEHSIAEPCDSSDSALAYPNLRTRALGG